MKTLILNVVICLSLIACAEKRIPPPPPVVKLGPVEAKPVFHNLLVYVDAGGLDVFCTRTVFEERFPEIKASDAKAHSGFTMTGGGSSETLTFSETMGVYCHTDNVIWLVCTDPSHLTENEQWALAHERCHRQEYMEGQEIADRSWAMLPKAFRTHPEVERRLLAKGLIK